MKEATRRSARVTIELGFVTAVTVLAALWAGAVERSHWSTDDPGDPDGDAILAVVQLLGGVAGFLLASAVVASVEAVRWLRNRRR